VAEAPGATSTLAAALVAPIPAATAPSGPPPTLPPATAPPPRTPDAAPPPGKAADGNGGGAGTTTAPVQPQAVAPQALKKRAAPVQKTAPTRKLRPGDLICGDCGEGNAPTRKFCSRCGATLATAVVVKEKWWRRLLPRRKPKTLAAGERPGQGGVKAKKKRSLAGVIRPIRMVVSIALLFATIAYGVYSPFREWVNDRWTSAKDRVDRVISPDYVPVNASQAVANLETPEHPGAFLTDGFKNTFWSAPVGGPEPTVVLTFSEPVDLDRAIVHNGSGESFQSQHRAKDLHLVYSTGETFDVTLKDTPDEQQVDIDGAQDVTSVEVHVVSIYEALQGTDLAVSEIEFFRKE
jgi:hypothetical protein